MKSCIPTVQPQIVLQHRLLQPQCLDVVLLGNPHSGPATRFGERATVVSIALAVALNLLRNLIDLLLHRLGSTDVANGVAGAIDGADDAHPRTVHGAEISNHLLCPLAHGIGEGLLSQSCCVFLAALVFQRLDSLVRARVQVVISLVEAGRCFGWLIRKLDEVLRGLADRSSEHAVHFRGGARHFAQDFTADLSGPDRRRQGFGSSRLRAFRSRDLHGFGLELIVRLTRVVAGKDSRVGVACRLFAALHIGVSERDDGLCCQAEGRQQALDVATHRPGSRSNATKGGNELGSLSHQRCQGRLTALDARKQALKG
ncbi:hypothetical protein D3C87_1159020 [compost metagenome]